MTTTTAPGSSIRTYVELTKPRIIELLLITTVPAMVVAADGWPGWGLVLATLIGGTLSAGGANTINQVADRDIDRIMARTSGRPIPTDRVEPRRALVFGIALGILGFVVLAASSNVLAATISTAGLLFYVFIYTLWLKRSSAQNIVLGGAAGAVPALVGWAAVTDDLGLAPWIMFAIVFFWTPPHFWALAIRYKEDYAAAGVPMLPVVVGERRTLEHITPYTAVMVGLSLLLYPTGVVDWIYLVSAVSLGAWIMMLAVRLTPRSTMRFFGISNLYLGGLFVAMAVDRLIL